MGLGKQNIIVLSHEYLRTALKIPLLFQFMGWLVLSLCQTFVFPFLFFARIMSTLFILTVPTTRRMTAAHLHPRLCLTEPARCPAAALIPSARGTNAAATTGASMPASSLFSHHQVERPAVKLGQNHVKIVVVAPMCSRWEVWLVWVEDKTVSALLNSCRWVWDDCWVKKLAKVSWCCEISISTSGRIPLMPTLFLGLW